ncbi:radical SAM protein [Bdellovibrionota bacterium]
MTENQKLAYDYPPYRPPSESDSALIRASHGCPWNKCQFCMMYKSVKFKAKPLEEVKKDIDTAAEIYSGSKTIFIGDSDSLIMKDIEEIIRYTKSKFPQLERITSYARAKSLKKLGLEKLKRMKSAGLTRVHVGLESGDAETLELLCKGETPEDMISGGRAAKEAGLELCFYILVGGGGKGRLKEHAIESAKVCNEANPDFIRLRTLVALHGSPLEEKKKQGLYKPTSPIEKLEEVKLLIENLDLTDCELASDHFSNNILVDNQVVYRGIYGRLPKDKSEMLSTLDEKINLLQTAQGDVVDVTILYERGFITSL